MTALLTENEFSQHLNTKFRTTVNDQDLDLELVEVKGYQPQDSEQRGMERFSLFFQGTNHYLPQGLYSLEHEKMGQLEIFLVPISQSGGNYHYEAVFNYYREQAGSAGPEQ